MYSHNKLYRRTDRQASEQGKQANKDISIFGSNPKSRLLHNVVRVITVVMAKRGRKKGESQREKNLGGGKESE